MELVGTAETRNCVYRFGIAKEQGMLHQMAKSAIWQDQKKLSRNTSKKTKTYLLFERQLSEFEVEMGLRSASNGSYSLVLNRRHAVIEDIAQSFL